MLSLILLVFAFVLLLIAAAGGAGVEPFRNRLALYGFACWVLSAIVTQSGFLK